MIDLKISAGGRAARTEVLRSFVAPSAKKAARVRDTVVLT